ncbi:MAG: calcineurin-like phosphoesterase C-terminal domain-containing protein [Balneolaceae bacterium]|nr:calcineurin-like phosphoesterase C-terminal domain-containing protein [Balneolaceae bacterium]
MHFFGNESGWPQQEPHIHYNVGTTSGDWWSGVPNERNIPPTLMRDGTPNGYAMINFRGNQFTLDYKGAGYNETYRMSMWGPEVVPQDSWHSADLYVNYFLGSERTKVEYKVGDTDWNAMQKVEEGDPAVAMLRQKWDTSKTLLAGKRPSNPVESTHLWSTGVPNNLPIGPQTIEIRVTDMFGRQFFDEFKYEVVRPGGN